MFEPVEFTTKRLIIRDLNWKDLGFIHSLHSIAEVDKYATLGIPGSLEDSKRYLKRYIEQQDLTVRKEYGFCITLLNEEPIGLIGLNNSQSKFQSAEIWYKLDPKHWGCGYSTESAAAVLEFGFKKILLHRIEAGVAKENVASMKVLEKIGMKMEGLRRQMLPIRGNWKDSFLYAILEEDYYSVSNGFDLI